MKVSKLIRILWILWVDYNFREWYKKGLSLEIRKENYITQHKIVIFNNQKPMFNLWIFVWKKSSKLNKRKINWENLAKHNILSKSINNRKRLGKETVLMLQDSGRMVWMRILFKLHYGINLKITLARIYSKIYSHRKKKTNFLTKLNS